MRLGFLTAPLPDTPLMDVADWAAEAEFDSLEIACWPRSARRPARRTPARPTSTSPICSDQQAQEIVAEINGKGLAISGLGFYPNPLHADPAVRDPAIAHIKAVIEACQKMGVPFMNTFMGGDHRKNLDENWEEALRVWPDIVKYAQDNGVKITIENCPMIFSYDEWPGGNNIAWSPMIWRRIIEQWGGTIGLNYDPSHLVWLMIDQGRFIREFGAAHLPLPGQGRDDRPRRPVRARHAVVAAWAGRSRACPAWATPIGEKSSPTCISLATTETASSSTRIGASKEPTSS